MTSDGDHLSSTLYAERRKELLNLVKQLRAIGAQADLDLPRIAVIGNQSAGKSSVVEAISGITVPRDAGTCTRCPMECRLASSSGPWSCQISIRWEFGKSGKRRNDVKEVPFGPLLLDPSTVELALRRAQAAVLNPERSLSKFLDLPVEELGERELAFSRNVVCLDLTGPELTDLSFIDLPGIIHAADPAVVNLIEDLVVSHIKGNTLILVTLPMTDDIENQKALRLARQEDPDGRRTIGVLTKPDMLSAGSTKARALWMEVVEGKNHPLRHGYFCTRQPDDAERARDITAAEARASEEKFFQTAHPWADSPLRNRFGTKNLVATLGRLLTNIITETLPKIHDEAMKCITTTTAELEKLPEAIQGEPATHVLTLLTELCRDIQQFVSGSPDAGELIHKNRDAFAAFKRDIRSTAPHFLPYPDGPRVNSRFDFWLPEEDDDGELAAQNSSKSMTMTLKDMRAHIRKSITRELPDNVPFEAKAVLIRQFQASWNKHSVKCFETVRNEYEDLLMERIERQFGRFDSLHHVLKSFVHELVERHWMLCLQHLENVLKGHLTPFTQNTHYLQVTKDKWLSKYKDARAGKANGMPGQPAGEPAAKRVRLDATSNTAASTSTQAPSSSNAFNFNFGASATPKFGASATPKFGASATPKFGAPVPATAATQGRTDKPTKNGVSDSPRAFGSSTAAPASPAPRSESGSSSSGSGASGQSASAKAPATNGASSANSSTRSTPDASPRLSVTLPAPSFVSAAPTPDPEKINAALACLAELGYSGLTAEDLGKLNPPDVYESEIAVMAEVRAYFQVAYKRVIDEVPQNIDLLFVRSIADGLQGFLIAKLGLGTQDAGRKCALYLAEDPNIVARRDELLARKRRLDQVLVELYAFGF